MNLEKEITKIKRLELIEKLQEVKTLRDSFLKMYKEKDFEYDGQKTFDIGKDIYFLKEHIWVLRRELSFGNELSDEENKILIADMLLLEVLFLEPQFQMDLSYLKAEE